MVDAKEQIKRLLQELGLPDWLVDENGELVLGHIVKYYREQKTYIDSDGMEKQWTQKILAKALKLKEHTVQLMETKSQSLNSIERRKALIEILGIPSALLGLTNLTVFETLKTLQTEIEVPNVLTSKRSSIRNQDIKLYQSAVGVYTQMYTDRKIQTALPDIEQWIAQIDENLKSANSTQKPVIQRILWDFHILAARTYGYDLCNWTKASSHTDDMRELANSLDNPDLKVMSLFLPGCFWINRERPFLAKDQFDIALTIAKKEGSPPVRGMVYGVTALSHGLTATDTASRIYVQNLLKSAREHKGLADDNNSIYSESEYLRDTAETLVTMGDYGEALQCLRDANTSDKRLLEFLNLLEAECLIKQKKPQYERGVILLSGVLEENKQAREQVHIAHVARLYKFLTTTSYKNVPDVTYLGQTLRELQRK